MALGTSKQRVNTSRSRAYARIPASRGRVATAAVGALAIVLAAVLGLGHLIGRGRDAAAVATQRLVGEPVRAPFVQTHGRGVVVGVNQADVSRVRVALNSKTPLVTRVVVDLKRKLPYRRSEEHTSELQSHSFISYAVFCLKKKKHV